MPRLPRTLVWRWYDLPAAGGCGSRGGACGGGVGEGAARVMGSDGMLAAWGCNRIITERREERA